MSQPLRSEVVRTGPMLLAATGITALAVGAALVGTTPTASQVAFVAPPAFEAEETSTAVTFETRASTELSLVFSVNGTSFMKLTDIGEEGEAMPSHAAPSLTTADGVESAVARIDAADIPLAYRHWQGRTVMVDSACEAQITGFAVVSRLTGDTGYAGVDDAAWTADDVLARGSVVLAAQLSGCSGTYARDARLSPVIVTTPVTDDAVAARAREALIASSLSQEAQVGYLEFDKQTPWWRAEDVQLATKIVRHPTTGVTWVSVHGRIDGGCGGPDVNLWGLYRVEPDGTLVASQVRRLDDLVSIERLVDVDNDGELEMIGSGWLGLDTVAARSSGPEIDRLRLSFYGCGC